MTVENHTNKSWENMINRENSKYSFKLKRYGSTELFLFDCTGFFIKGSGVRTYSWTPKGVDKYVHERAN